MASKRFPTQPMIGLLVRMIYQHYSQAMDAALGPEEITGSELAELAHVRKQTMAQAVEQLELTGYVERKPSPSDRRSQLVFLTERGKSVPPVTHAAAASPRRASGPVELISGTSGAANLGAAGPFSVRANDCRTVPPECRSAPQGVLPHSEALQHSGVGVDRRRAPSTELPIGTVSRHAFVPSRITPTFGRVTRPALAYRPASRNARRVRMGGSPPTAG
jgi:MarR family